MSFARSIIAPEKATIEDLALFGGSPAFSEPLHVGRPNLGDRQALLERIGDVLDRRWFTNDGPLVREFERRVCDRLGAAHCVAICNGTVALEIAIRAAGLTGEVIVPSFTFVATAHALQWQQIAPVFCDIGPGTHNLDPAGIERHITPRTTGIVGVHLWGKPCDVDALSELAARRGLTLMFDASHAFGCAYRGRAIGTFGLAEVFSFHATKFVNTFEGGAVVTNDDALARKMRLMRNFGFAGYDQVDCIGTNGKLNEVSAAMGLTSLDAMDGFIETNRRHYERYSRLVRGLPGLTLTEFDPAERPNYQYIVLDVDADRAGLTRDRLVKLLWAENVRARRYFFPACHRMQPYADFFPHAGLLLPETERAADRVLLLPTGASLTEAEIDRVGGLLRFFLERSPAIARRMDGLP